MLSVFTDASTYASLTLPPVGAVSVTSEEIKQKWRTHAILSNQLEDEASGPERLGEHVISFTKTFAKKSEHMNKQVALVKHCDRQTFSFILDQPRFQPDLGESPCHCGRVAKLDAAGFII